MTHRKRVHMPHADFRCGLVRIVRVGLPFVDGLLHPGQRLCRRSRSEQHDHPRVGLIHQVEVLQELLLRVITECVARLRLDDLPIADGWYPGVDFWLPGGRVGVGDVIARAVFQHRTRQLRIALPVALVGAFAQGELVPDEFLEGGTDPVVLQDRDVGGAPAFEVVFGIRAVLVVAPPQQHVVLGPRFRFGVAESLGQLVQRIVVQFIGIRG